MKLAYILLALALLLPPAVSAPLDDCGTSQKAELIDVAHQDHAKDVAYSGQFVGSIKSNKYHYPNCRAAKNIKDENKIWFASSEDARAHGYVPCSICNPP